MDYEAILTEAHAAATARILKLYREGKREQPMNCGFGWVTVPARGKLVLGCKSNLEHLFGCNWKGDTGRYGSPGYPKGWQWWKPGTWPSVEELEAEGLTDVISVYEQDMDFHVSAAQAFAEVLRSHGLEASTGCRLD